MGRIESAAQKRASIETSFETRTDAHLQNRVELREIRKQTLSFQNKTKLKSIAAIDLFHNLLFNEVVIWKLEICPIELENKFSSSKDGFLFFMTNLGMIHAV